MNRLGVGIGLLAVLASAAGAASPDPKDLAIPSRELEKARVLARDLGSDLFRDRERAERELAAMGRLARPVLAEVAAADPSPEVRSRVARLLPRAEAADLQARVDTFLADADGKFRHDLPGLDLFRKHVGDDPAARGLYVEVLKTPANLALLASADGAGADGGKAVADRRMGLFLQQNPGAFNRFGGAVPGVPRQPALADIAALLVAESVVPADDIPRPGPFGTIGGAYFLSTPAAAAAAANPAGNPHGPPFVKVVARWMDTRTAPADLDQVGWVAQNMKQFPESTRLLRRVVTTPGVQGWARAQAVGFLVARNKADERAFLRSLLNDDTQAVTVWLGNNPQGGAVNQATCQLRDLALGVLILLDEGDLKAYGFEVQPGGIANLMNIGNGQVSFAFTSDDKREAGHKKWAAEQAKKAGAAPPTPIGPPRPVERK
ncbi:MAG: hypothetical protein K2X82_24645 [Gemmataceae bacterium]|nr:hypothetical protein [Gemmataceae bacterium]